MKNAATPQYSINSSSFIKSNKRFIKNLNETNKNQLQMTIQTIDELLKHELGIIEIIQ